MTREELIDKVMKPWKKGDVVQGRFANDNYQEWSRHCDGDPLHSRFNLRDWEYRIKPRTKKWVIDITEHANGATFQNIANLLDVNHYADDFVESIRNAKPLEEKENE